MSAQSLFPHQQLKWLSSNLEQKLRQAKPKSPVLLQLARMHLSLGFFHNAGEGACAKALGYAQKALQEDAASHEALTLAGLALIGIDRPNRAMRHLQSAQDIDENDATLQLALGNLARVQGDIEAMLISFEKACRLAPKSWETNLFFGRSLLALGIKSGKKRSVERAQFHLIQAQDLNIIADKKAVLFKDLGIACLHTGRLREAEKYFSRLIEVPQQSYTARLHLGLVAYQLGKYNNAINHFRSCIQEKGEDARLLAHMALSWYQLGDFSRARGACKQTLIREPYNLTARHILGASLLEEGKLSDAHRVFRDTLKEHPEHMESYAEIVRIRRLEGDISWLNQALHAEVSNYDHQPVGGEFDASELTLSRIEVILQEFQEAGSVYASCVLRSIEYTQDEHLRFRLWETASKMVESYMSYETEVLLQEPGKNYGFALGESVASLHDYLDIKYLIQGLSVTDVDLEHAATERYSPAHDVEQHWQNLNREKIVARTYQALILLSIGLKKDPKGLELVKSWAATADVDMKLASHLSLIISGEAGSLKALKQHARTREKQDAYLTLKNSIEEVTKTKPAPSLVRSGATCQSCSRSSDDAMHMLTAQNNTLCNYCIVDIFQNRHNLVAPDDAFCSFCDANHFSGVIYKFKDIYISEKWVQYSLREQEREQVDLYFASRTS